MENLKLLKQKVLVTGANGLLGQKIVEVFVEDFDVHGIGRKKRPSLELSHYDYTLCDITNREQIFELVWVPPISNEERAESRVVLSARLQF